MLARAVNWAVGQRVCREEAPESVGTVTDASSVEIKVIWDNGAISFHQLGAPVSLKHAPEQ
jgi:hypothetical protein